MGYFKTFLQKPEENTVLLIDGDLYAYRACAAAEEEIDWGDDIWSLSSDLKQAKEIFREFIDSTCDNLETGSFVVCLSDKDNFRKTIDPMYKGGRKKVRKPVGYSAFIKWIQMLSRSWPMRRSVPPGANACDARRSTAASVCSGTCRYMMSTRSKTPSGGA